jgi:hypothetical protein
MILIEICLVGFVTYSPRSNRTMEGAVDVLSRAKLHGLVTAELVLALDFSKRLVYLL